MTTDHGLTRRLYRDFILQAVYISAAVVVGIFAVSIVVKDVLIKQALRGEAEFYWETVAERPNLALPETRNMVSFRAGHGKNPPNYLIDLDTGFHKVDQPMEALAYVTEKNGDKFYLLFDTGRVGWLITWFGLVPLAIVLAFIYVSLFQAYRVSSRAISPIVNLSRQVKNLDPANPDAALFSDARLPADTDVEIRTLNSAMQDLTNRLVAFVERESNFTRDASHELRSPLTVIRMASEKLLQRSDLDTESIKLLERIHGSSKDMGELTEAFLLLARESNQAIPEDWISVNDLIDQEIDRARLLVHDKTIELSQHATCKLLVLAPEKVLASIIGNLLRNGVNYTDEGQVTVQVKPQEVTIKDSGSGMSKQELALVFKPFNRGSRERFRGGHGVGLTIVQRLCDRFGWPLSIESTPGVGTSVTVSFPKARISTG